MRDQTRLSFSLDLPVRASNAGLFIKNGPGRHPSRIINSYELIYVEKGKLEIAEEGTEFCINEGHYLLLYPNRRHWGLSEYQAGLRFYWLHFNMMEKTGRDNSWEVLQTGIVVWPNSIVELFQRFIHCQESGFNLAVERDLLTLLILCELNRQDTTLESAGQAVILAERANTYIQLHLMEPLTRAYLAEKIFCNADYLGRVIRKVYHRSVTELIHDHRVKRSIQLLRTVQDNIEEIAYQCGYPNARNFRIQFKLRKGMTPGQFRSLFTQKHINTN